MEHIGGEPGISAYYYCSANRTLLRGKRLRPLTYAVFPVRSYLQTGGAIFILILIIIHYNQNKVNVLNIQNSSHFYIFCTYTAFFGELLCGCYQGYFASGKKKKRDKNLSRSCFTSYFHWLLSASSPHRSHRARGQKGGQPAFLLFPLCR